MKKIAKLLIITVFILGVIVTAVACSNTSDGIEYKNIERIEVDGESIAEGFKLSEFQVSDIKINVYYKGTLASDGSAIDGEVKSIPLTTDMILAEDKGFLAVAGQNTIRINYGKFSTEFVLKLFDDKKVTYKVNFIDENGSALGGTQYVFEGERVNAPTPPTKVDYDFVGWFNELDGTQHNLENIQSNLILKAKYIPSVFEVGYYTRTTTIGANGAVNVSEKLIVTAKVPNGGDALLYAPSIPTIPGYSNGRWEDEESMKGVNTHGLKFYAIYDQDSVLVTFRYYKYGEAYTDEARSYTVNSYVSNSINPERAGYKFVGWYANGNPVSFPYKVSNEIVFEGKYISLSQDNLNADLVGNSGLKYAKVSGNYWIKGFDNKVNVVVIAEKVKVDGEEPSNIVGILPNAFDNCKIEEFVVSPDNEFLSTHAGVLYNLDKTVLLRYPNSNTLTTYTIAPSTVEIGTGAFRHANNLTTVLLSSNNSTQLKIIGDYAFFECEGLTSIEIPKMVESIGAYAFCMGTKTVLEKIDFSKSVALSEIGNYAFGNCDKLIRLDLPATLTTLGDGVFYGCNRLKNIEIATNDNFCIFEGGLYDIGKTKLYVYPADADILKEPELVLPSTLTDIMTGAIYYARISSLVINSTINLHDKSIISPNLEFLRILSDDVGSYSLNSFGGSTPKNILVQNGNSKLSQLQKDFGSSVQSYDPSKWENLNNYVNNYIFKIKIVNRMVGTELKAKKEAVIVGMRNPQSVLDITPIINYNNETLDVTEIGDFAFCGDRVLTAITLPASIEIIGEQAFANMTELVSISINDAVNTIKNRAFYNSRKLSKITFSSKLSITTLGDECFDGTEYYNAPDEASDFRMMNGLLLKYFGQKVSVTIPNTVTAIGPEAFANKSNLTSVTINGENLVTIGKYAFYFCSGIRSIALPISVKLVDVGAFYNCNNLALVTYAGELTTKPKMDDAFNTTVSVECKGGSVFELIYTLPDGSGTESVKGNTFVAPKKFSSVVGKIFAGWYTSPNFEGATFAKFPLTITAETTLYPKMVDENVGSEGLIFAKVEGGYSLVQYNANINDRYLVIPQKYKNGNVISIAGDLLHGSNGLIEEIVLPTEYSTASVTLQTIGLDAFTNSQWYKNFRGDFVVINDFLIAYKGNAESVTLPESVNKIADGAFANNSNIKELKFSKTIKNVPISMAENCQNLEKVVLSSNLDIISSKAFYGCNALTDINFLDAKNLSSIASDALTGTKFVVDYVDDCIIINNILYKYRGVSESLHIPSGVVSIANEAFAGNRLKNVYIPASVVLIGNRSFYNCDNLTYVNIFELNSALSYIGESAFENCINLVKINLQDCVSLRGIGDNAFKNTVSLSTISLPSSFNAMGEGCFEDSGLKSISFANQSVLLNISKRAFYNNLSLNKVMFGKVSYLISIGEYAFYNCINLREFYNPSAKISRFEDYAFYNCTELTNLTINERYLVHLGNNSIYKLGYIYNRSDAMLMIGGTLVAYRGTSKSVNIPSTISTIYNEAFMGNTYINTIIFDSATSVTSVNDRAFYGCTNLSEISFPSSITYVGDEVMNGTKWYEQQVRDGVEFITVANTLVKYNNNGEKKSVVLPDNITAVNMGAFENCIVLNVDLGANVKRIATGAFDGIISSDTVYYKVENEVLTSQKRTGWSLSMRANEPIDLPVIAVGGDKLSRIYVGNIENYRQNSTMASYFAVKNLVNEIKNHKITLKTDTLNQQDVLTNILYSEDHVAQLYKSSSNQDLESVANGKIFVGWFLDSEFVTRISYPLIVDANLTLYAKFVSLDKGSNFGAYERNDAETVLEAYNSETSKDPIIVIPAHNNTDGETNPKFYTQLAGKYHEVSSGGTHNRVLQDDGTYAYVPAPSDPNAKYKYVALFENNSNITTVYFAEGSKITTISANVFANCTELRKIILPSTITTIEEGAFNGCTNLKEIIFTNSKDNEITIKTNAFQNCTSLRSIVFSANVKEIQSYAFRNCNELIDVTFLSENVPTIGSEPFGFVSGVINPSLLIHVPKTQVYNYKNKWNIFKNYIVGAL